MKSIPLPRIRFPLLIIFLTITTMAASSTNTDNKSEEKSVHIVYVNRPEAEEAEDFHVRTLASVLGSEETAKEAIIYHYKHAASGFSAKLTPKQAEALEKKEEVLQVMQDKVLHLHSAQQKPAAGAVRTMNLM